MPKPAFFETNHQLKTLLVAIDAPYNPTNFMQSYYEEFFNLVKTAGFRYEDVLHIRLRSIDSGYFFTKGKMEEIHTICKEKNIEQVILSDRISPQQRRNLEDFLDVELMDRTDLILDIFDKSATSAEGKIQVAIAMLQHDKTRLAGKGVHLSQQTGVKGLIGGPGEKQKERERRHIVEQIRKMKRRLIDIQQSRTTQRKKRLENQVNQLCLIGYTNAGKSTILNALTKSDVLAEDKLFATLDTTTRSLFINSEKIGVLSDTVGFIQQLPHHLIEAFKSTLSELHFASLLMQVIDLSDPNWKGHIKVVQEILQDLEVDKQMLYVFNKIDKIPNLEAIIPELELYEPHVLISAKNKKGLKPLVDFLGEWKPKIGE